MGSILTK